MEQETLEQSVESIQSYEDSEESEKSYDDLVQLMDATSLALPLRTPLQPSSLPPWDPPAMKLSFTWQYTGDVVVHVDLSSLPSFTWQEGDLLLLAETKQQVETYEMEDVRSRLFCSYLVPSHGSILWERKVSFSLSF